MNIQTAGTKTNRSIGNEQDQEMNWNRGCYCPLPLFLHQDGADGGRDRRSGGKVVEVEDVEEGAVIAAVNRWNWC